MAEYDDNITNDSKQHIPRAKELPIKKTNKNKPLSLTVNKSYLKEAYSKKICEDDNDETIDTSSNKGKDEYELMNLDSKQSTLDPPNTGHVIDRNDETETTEKLL